MDCKEADRKLHPWLDGELPPDEARRMAEHVGGCETCAAEARRLSILFDELDALPAVPPDPALVRATLREAFASPLPPIQWWRRLPPLHKGAGFAAMAAGVVLGVFLFSASGINGGAKSPDTAANAAFILSVSEVEYL